MVKVLNRISMHLMPAFLLFLAVNTSAQTDSVDLKYPFKDEVRFPFSNSGTGSPLYLNNPSNIRQEIRYDPQTGRYEFTEKMGSLDYRPPATMSLREYMEYDRQKSVNDYWRTRLRENKSPVQAGQSMIPGIKMGETFDKVFGTDVITITPQGSAELIFGYNMSRVDNPALSEKNRRNPSFLFKERIQMNVTGSIGDKMQLGINYNTEASFDFENKTKLEYTGKEDEIIKKIEAGNVTFSLPGTLITGSQSLFGLKTDLQFGKLFVSSVISHQKGQSQVVEVKGGAQVSEFEIDAVDYDANRHFFLSHFFRDNYNEWLSTLPFISSGVRIEQIEVWVTNKGYSTTDTRNILALTDMAEGYHTDTDPNFIGNVNLIQPSAVRNGPPDKETSNQLYSTIISQYVAVRTFNDISTALLPLELSYDFKGGKDYVKIENARRLTPNEYHLNEELGYISLNSALRADEVLAVAYVYTYKGRTYRVGELSTDGIAAPQTLLVKLLKGTSLTPKSGTWDLMMKNVYAIGAYQVSNRDFILDVLYRKDETGVPVNYIAENGTDSAFNRKILLRVMGLDRLDTRNEPRPDGRFDFVEGTTITARDGRVFFTQVEPFGADLRRTITGGNINDAALNRIADKYVFEELYDSTQTKARQLARKNKFFMAGSYQAASGSEIQLNAMNIPPNSVKVSSGGITLVEGQDYSVDYALGRVKILNQGLLQSGAPLSISLENNALFNLQTKTLLGTHLDYRFSDNFNVGATIMNLTERPLTQKVNMGDEPISNTIWGLNTNYRTESRFLTRMIDKLPLIETKETSTISFDAEFAHLIPGQAKIIGEGGVAYIDDFEGTETTIELKTPQSWYLSSTPYTLTNPAWKNDLRYGYGRSKLAWYSIDPLFTRNESRTPDNITEADQKDHFAREILETEIFKNRESGTGFQNTLLVMNLAYYPQERGPYNFDPTIGADGLLPNPQDRWGGIMRELQTSDFETSNIEYIEFWLMDPFVKDSLHAGGDLYFNLGEISEDVLKDSRKFFENGLPTVDTTVPVETSVWGNIPVTQNIVNTFDADPRNRALQDVGLDGLSDEQERVKFSNYINSVPPSIRDVVSADPSADNFRYFLSPEYNSVDGIIPRYKDYNNMQGNSPTTEQSGGDFAAATTLPNTEDLNRDNTLNEEDSYYEYRVPIRPNQMNFDNPYITDIVDGKGVKWYQFRIPISDFQSKVGNIEDFKSIRFMRMYLTQFSSPVIMRFAELHLVRSEWRKYFGDLAEGGPSVTDQTKNGTFEITSVNIEENASKKPVNYVLPPGIDRVIDPSQPQIAQLNEQSLVFKVRDLPDADARVAYKNMNIDLRQYKYLRMFVHAEALQDEVLRDHEVSAFIRLGSDQTDNYYEYEVPLVLTPHGLYADEGRRLVWPDSNLVQILLDDLVDLKVERDKAIAERPDLYDRMKVYKKRVGKNTLKIRGTPNLANIRSMLLGVRNPGDTDNPFGNDGLPKSVEVWFNELRITDFNNKGGWAANARTQIRLADLGTLSIAGSTSKPGFGSIEQKVDDRNQEETNQIDIASNIELGKLLPEKAKVSVPLYVGVSKITVTPEYSEKEPDRKLKDVLTDAENAEERREIKETSQDVIKRTSVNLTNVRVNKEFEKFRLLSPSNFSLTAEYSESQAHNYEVERNNAINYGLAFNYIYSSRAKPLTPFRNSKGLKSPYLKLIKDFNVTLIPSRLAYRTEFARRYNEIKLRNVYEDRDILLDSTVSKDFVWNKGYELNWDLTRSLKFDFNINSVARIDEMEGAYDFFRKGENKEWARSVWESIGKGGRPITYNHRFNSTYTLPLNKLPFLSWTAVNLRYNSGYNWLQGPFYKGNTPMWNEISNSNTIQANSTFNLTSLYNKSKYLKKLESKYAPTKNQQKPKNYKTVTFTRDNFFLRPHTPRNISHKLNTRDLTVKVTDREGREIETSYQIIDENKISIEADTNYNGLQVVIEGKVETGEKPLIFLAENSVRFLTGLKNMTVSYSVTGGTMLSGFNPEPDRAGFNTTDYKGAPGLPFLLGIQDENFARHAASKGWLTRNDAFSEPFTMSRTETFNIKGTFEPYKGFRIDLTGSRSFSEFNSEYFHVGDSLPGVNGFYFDNHLVNGGFSISIISLRSAFEKNKEGDIRSDAFERFKMYRTKISGRLARHREEQTNGEYQASIQHTSDGGYKYGYGSTSPEVVIPAFIAAYTGKDPEKVTLTRFPGILSILPNWAVIFDGLPKIKPVDQVLRSATLRHTYRSIYSINSYSSHFMYERNDIYGIGFRTDLQDNFVPELQMNSVAIREDMDPLFSFDGTWINNLITRVEIRRSRLLALSLANNQLTESKTSELIVGAGYRFTKVALKIGERAYESDLDVKFNLSMRDNKTIVRYFAQTDKDEHDQITMGDRLFRLEFTADYLLSPRFNLRFFFDRTLNKPHTSRSFKRIDTNIGFSLRFTLTQ